MKPKMIELRPNRELLNPNFNGYKLSLATLPVCQTELNTPVDRAAPDAGQYSILHARLFGLHNHIFGEEIDGASYVYFVDKNWCLWKMYVEPFLHYLVDPFPVFRIPKNSEREQGQYNITLKFVTSELAVLSDGHGVLYLLNTGIRSADSPWDVVYDGEILGTGNKFVIQDAVCTDKNELHLLLLRIEQDSTGEHWINILNWIVMARNNEKWDVIATKELQARGELHYSHFEADCTAVYISSEKSFKFVTDEAETTDEKNNESNEDKRKRYVWSQTIESITVKFKLPQNYEKSNLKITSTDAEILVQYENYVLLSGALYQNISPDLTSWNTGKDVLEISLSKVEIGLMWPELVVGDENGELVVDSCIADEVHQKLSHLCGENEADAATGTTFNSQEVEECDFVDEKSYYFERISLNTHEVTHRVNLGTCPVILTAELHEELPPALGLRYDVDVCLWQPKKINDADWQFKHEGTLYAFGYIQASKQQKKFVACTPDFSHAVVCESSRHIFVYCQNKSVTSGDLRNRNTGERVQTIAEQRVISIDSAEILGLYLSNMELFVLTESKMFCFKL